MDGLAICQWCQVVADHSRERKGRLPGWARREGGHDGWRFEWQIDRSWLKKDKMGQSVVGPSSLLLVSLLRSSHDCDWTFLEDSHATVSSLSSIPSSLRSLISGPLILALIGARTPCSLMTPSKTCWTATPHGTPTSVAMAE